MARTLELPAELTIYTVGELRPQWLSWLGEESAAAARGDDDASLVAAEATIDTNGGDEGDDRKASAVEPDEVDETTCLADGAAVDQVDAAGLQLLVALSNLLEREQRTLRVVRASRPLGEACEALGLGALLAPPEPAEVQA